MAYYRKLKVSDDKNLRAYIIGLALGDGNLSNPNGRAIRLRITCDKKYPILIDKIADSLQKLFPENKVALVERESCVDVSVYSNYLEDLLGWKVGQGSKFKQNVSMPEWIKKDLEARTYCLRGLIETDGSIYYDRGYKMVIFSNIVESLATDVYESFKLLGFKPHFYKIKQGVEYNHAYSHKYQVRLSKNSEQFLDLVRPEKV